MEKDNMLILLPEEHEVYFYQGQYYALNELLKKVGHSFTADMIRQELFQLKLKLMKLQAKRTNTPYWGS